MPVRTHIGRDLDIRLVSNVAVMALALVSAVIALVLWLDGEPADLFWSPAYVFIAWALLREIDPDHNWTGLAAAAATGAWALVGRPTLGVLAFGGLMLACRLVSETTGRRPLPTDLAVATAAGIAISFTIAGWVAGFAIAVAIYLDDRFAETHRGVQVAAAAVTAVGATVVGAAARAFPETMPELEPVIVVAVGVAALLLVAREPADPISQVDARHAAFMDGDRLHASRALAGIATFAMAALLGAEAEQVVPLGLALVLALVSNEIELIRRPEM